MKKFLITAILLGLICLMFYYRYEIIEYVTLNFIYRNEFKYEIDSKYKKNEFSYFKQIDTYKPQDKKDIINIIYSNINNGLNNFNFYCPLEYTRCMDDVQEIIGDTSFLSNINNFLSPYNTYDKLDVTLSSLGKVNINVEKYYDEEMIVQIDKKVDELITQLINNNMSTYDKIKVIHDYVINNSIYDKEKEKYLNTDIMTTYNSHIAYGPLFEGYGICSGYSDLISIFLDKLNIPNYRISNDNHVWNLVYVDDKWLHLDATWDDPVTDTGKQIINYDYFLITTNQLKENDNNQHIFDGKIYKEAKLN